jgi:methanogenic corrinoid protein MtbC1
LFDEDGPGIPCPARPVILIGGGQVDEQVFSVVGADYWAPDAMSAVRLCERLMTNG